MHRREHSPFFAAEITIDVLRGLQGLGSAAAIPASVSGRSLCSLRLYQGFADALLQLGILAHSFPPSKTRSIAFATFAAGAPVGAAIGSAIGGVLTQLTECVIATVFVQEEQY